MPPKHESSGLNTCHTSSTQARHANTHPINCPVRQLRLVIQRGQDTQRQEGQAKEKTLEKHRVPYDLSPVQIKSSEVPVRLGTSELELSNS